MRWHIRGNRFLHRMVRSMVGLLVDVGRERHPADAVAQVFAGRLQGERTWAPPQGLVLEGVYY
jgi:tRNA pseudouridine38-40 synthase